MTRAVVGREAELSAIDRLLDAVPSGLHGLVLEGEPGIGKTTLWEEARARAEARRLTVLAVRPSQSEARLSFAGLTDLFEPVANDLLDGLPPPQRDALQVALLRAGPARARPDRRAVGAACRSALGALASERPLVVAIDDVQWLDAPSRNALHFALRRLEGDPVGVVLAERPREEGANRPEVDSAIRPERLQRLGLGRLSLAALHLLIKQRLGSAPSRLMLQRIEQASAGNPFYALEIAREVLSRPLSPGEPLALPTNLQELVARRIADLPAVTRELLVAAAALARPTEKTVLAVVASADASALDAAEAAGVIARDNGNIRFTHPLVASTVYGRASATDLRRIHECLAQLVGDVEERARHLALAIDRPDEGVAARLDEAASLARSRGAPEAAADLRELALGLTPRHGGAQLDRRLNLAEDLFHAGETERAGRLLRLLIEETPPSVRRSEALVALATIQFEAGSEEEAGALCDEAQAEPDLPLELRAQIHATRAACSYEDVALQREHAWRSLELLEQLDDPNPGLLQAALVSVAAAERMAGLGIRDDLVRRALALERHSPIARVADRASAGLAVWLKWADELDEARRILLELLEAAHAEHDESSLPFAVSHLPQPELWAGNWPLAERYAQEHLELAEQLQQDGQRAQAFYNIAYVEAHLGRGERARAALEQVEQYVAAHASDWTRMHVLAVRGFLEWSLGNANATVELLLETRRLRAVMGVRDPSQSRMDADCGEALIALGDHDTARLVAGDLQERAEPLQRASALAAAARLRGLLAAAGGDFDQARDEFAVALAEHDRIAHPFERARTMLAKGQAERRAKRKADAKRSLEEALAVFERLGARLWAQRTRAELGRVGLRRSAPDELTPSELRVAELVATGMTNRGVAGKLFISPKTVEATLARVYRKLDIGSRAELGARLALMRAPV